MEIYKKIIDNLKTFYESDAHIIAMFVLGSFARGDIQRGNDLDILLMTSSADQSYAKEYYEDNILIEIGVSTLEKALESLDKNIMKTYIYLDAKVIFDKENILSKLKSHSQQLLNNYKPSEDEIKGIKKWLEAAKIKITSAKNVGDQLKLSFNTSNNLWKIVEGLYLINKMPVPASSTALFKIKSLEKLPENFEEIWEKTLLGNLEERSENTLKLIDFILSKI